MKISSFLLLLASIFIIILAWYLLTDVWGVRSIFLPSPQATFTKWLSLLTTGTFWLDVKASTYRVLMGFLFSFAVAYPLVIGSLINRNIKEVVFYQVEFFRYLPIPVFIPLTVLWFGVDDAGKLMVVFLGTFAQMIPMFYDSSMLLNRRYDAFIHALKWSRWKYIKNVIIPGAAPHVLDNARLCFGWAWTYLIIAELMGADHGIGYAIIRAQRTLNTDTIFAYILTIGIIGICTDRLMFYLKKQLFQWHT